MNRILIIDDEEGVCWALQQHLTGLGFEVQTAASAEKGFDILDSFHPNVVVMDIRLPGMDGLSALQKIKSQTQDIPVIIITAHGTMQTAVDAVKRGAYEYLIKPLDLDHSEIVIRRAMEACHLNKEIRRLREELASRGDGVSFMVGNSPAMQEAYKRIGAVSRSNSSVLITGESGTGKELAARAIHMNSTRKSGPFIAVNCASLPETLLENELYGHEKGAFTGAVARQKGKFELADKGTLFLDEISEISPSTQVKLLRFLESHTFERLGNPEPLSVDIRIIAATNRSLEELISDGSFREDLYYRLKVVSIEMPPLRMRKDDIPLLVAHFMNILSSGTTEISNNALKAIMDYSWPGNIRELRNAVEHAIVLARGNTILPEHLPESVSNGITQSIGMSNRPEDIIRQIVKDILGNNSDATGIHEDILSRFDKPLIKEVLRITGGNQVKAAEILGIHRTTLRKKISTYGL